jgi:hypothetical protein
LISKLLAYCCETWKLSKRTEDLLNSLERKSLRLIFGTVRGNGEWRIRYNEELYGEYKDFHLVSCIKFKRLQWAAHVQRFPLDCIPKKNPLKLSLLEIDQ